MAAPDGPAHGEVTRILHAIRGGEARASEELMRMVYAELRRIAAAKLAREPQGQTLQATALVHEAWLRMGEQSFENRAHFFAAAAEAMRRILVERVRWKMRSKHGAGAEHCELEAIEVPAPSADDDELLAVHDALDQLTAYDPRKAELVKLRYFVGLSFEEAAEVLGVSARTAARDWAFARAWLHREIGAR
jgi:RNA polymerase sigma factor (TIGR02999 family)